MTGRAAVLLAVALLLAVLVVVVALRLLRPLFDVPRCDAAADLRTYPFKTGDLILTADRPPLRRGGRLLAASTPVKLGTGSPVNHAAIVYVDPRTRQVLVWEIHGSGTRLATLYDLTCGRSNHYVMVRPLNKPVDTALFERIVARQWDRCVFNFDVALAWYNRYCMAFAPPVLKGKRWRTDGHQRTCVHMTTECYEALGVLDLSGTGVDATTIFASDYARRPHVELPMANGYEFGPLTRLRYECTDANRPRR